MVSKQFQVTRKTHPFHRRGTYRRTDDDLWETLDERTGEWIGYLPSWGDRWLRLAENPEGDR